ncbi:MAG: diguanylate cyclase domain-containing protein, partial [Anaerolineales bacterium]
TGLAEGALVDERLRECLETDEPWAALVISIENLDSFREAYGFIASDDVLRAVSLMINNSVRDLGSPNAFLGHLSSTQFVLVIKPSEVPIFSEHIQIRLEQSLDYFYPIKDRENPKEIPGDRICIRIGQFFPDDQAPTDLDSIKTTLLRQLN